MDDVTVITVTTTKKNEVDNGIEVHMNSVSWCGEISGKSPKEPSPLPNW